MDKGLDMVDKGLDMVDKGLDMVDCQLPGQLVVWW